MKAKNRIVINFLQNLNYGFIKVENNSVVHLTTGHILKFDSNLFEEINEDSTDEDIEKSENINIDINGRTIIVNYIRVIDFYIEEYAIRKSLIEKTTIKNNFDEMRQHLEYKFSQNGHVE